MSTEGISGYRYYGSGLYESHVDLLPTVLRALGNIAWPAGQRRLFELGCGSGGIANELTTHGYDVTGIDASTEGIQQAKINYPSLKLYQASVYDDLEGRYGRFPAILSLEVVEHLYFPRKFVKTAFNLLHDEGTAIISTPYHGYLKNLALAVTGKLDRHFTALWDHGHIKFWSIQTLSELMTEAGFQVVNVYRVGRVPPIAKSMVLVARKMRAGSASRRPE